MRTHRRYRGVAIYRTKTMVCGSDFEIGESGKIYKRKPQYTISFCFTNGYPCDTIKEVKGMIDELINQAVERDIPEKDMVDTINTVMV